MTNFDFSKTLYGKCFEENKQLTELYDELNKRYCKQQDESDIVREENKQIQKQLEIHKKYCDNCLKFQLGICGGAQYHIPKLCEQPLCDKVRKEFALKGKGR